MAKRYPEKGVRIPIEERMTTVDMLKSEKRYFTVAEVAEKLMLSPSTVRHSFEVGWRHGTMDIGMVMEEPVAGLQQPYNVVACWKRRFRNVPRPRRWHEQ